MCYLLCISRAKDSRMRYKLGVPWRGVLSLIRPNLGRVMHPDSPTRTTKIIEVEIQLMNLRIESMLKFSKNRKEKQNKTKLILLVY